MAYFHPGELSGLGNAALLASLSAASAATTSTVGSRVYIPELGKWITKRDTAAPSAGSELNPPDIDSLEAAKLEALQKQGRKLSGIAAAVLNYYRYYVKVSGKQPEKASVLDKLKGAFGKATASFSPSGDTGAGASAEQYPTEQQSSGGNSWVAPAAVVLGVLAIGFAIKKAL